jgi:hypothetical protein
MRKVVVSLLGALILISVVPSAEASNRLSLTFETNNFIEDCELIPQSCDENGKPNGLYSTNDFRRAPLTKLLTEDNCFTNAMSVKILGSRNQTVALGTIRLKKAEKWDWEDSEIQSNILGISCIYSGSISLNKSSFYRLIIFGEYSYEISHSALAKKKWKLNLEE